MKKELPLVVLEAFEEYVDKHGEYFTFINDLDNHLMHFIDNDPESNFFFRVKQLKQESQKYQLLIEKSPRDKSNVSGHSIWINLDQLGPHFRGWVGILEK